MKVFNKVLEIKNKNSLKEILATPQGGANQDDIDLLKGDLHNWHKYNGSESETPVSSGAVTVMPGMGDGYFAQIDAVTIVEGTQYVVEYYDENSELIETLTATAVVDGPFIEIGSEQTGFSTGSEGSVVSNLSTFSSYSLKEYELTIGVFVEDVTSEDSDAYPVAGISGDFYYEKEYNAFELIEELTSAIDLLTARVEELEDPAPN